jgi:hypothetical protein
MARDLSADIQRIAEDGGDPRQYREGLASLHRCPVGVIDAAILTVGAVPACIDAETVAVRRLDEDRHAARTRSAAWRTYQHEEE